MNYKFPLSFGRKHYEKGDIRQVPGIATDLLRLNTHRANSQKELYREDHCPLKTAIQNLILEKELSMASAVDEIGVATGKHFQNDIVSVFRKKGD